VLNESNNQQQETSNATRQRGLIHLAQHQI